MRHVPNNVSLAKPLNDYLNVQSSALYANAKLYEQAAEDLASTAGRAKSSLTRQWANSYIKEMRGRIGELWQDVGDLTQRGMAKEAPRGVAIQTDLLGDAADLAHLDLKSRFAATFARTPDEAIAAVMQGKLYSGPKAILSKRIWSNADLQAGKIEEVILQGLAKQQSPVQLAKALQAYVNPKALQPDIWNDIYEGCPFPLRVDYNAKRLAATSINHAYYSAALMTGRDNPFAVGIQWELSSFHVIYDVCDLYMEHDEGLGIGVYSFDSASIPHPFCRCNWYVTEGERSLEDIAKELYRWEQGESNPRLDKAFGKQNGNDLTYQFFSVNQIRAESGASLQIDDEVAHEITNAVNKVAVDFPILDRVLDFIEVADEPGGGGARADGRALRLDQSVFSKIATARAYLKEHVKSGHTHNASNPMFIVAHELGHILHTQLALQVSGMPSVPVFGGVPLKQYQAARNQIEIDWFAHSIFTDESVEEIYRMVYAELGDRAADSNSELIAQAFAMAYYGEGAHPIADSIVNYFIDSFRRFGK